MNVSVQERRALTPNYFYVVSPREPPTERLVYTRC